MDLSSLAAYLAGQSDAIMDDWRAAVLSDDSQPACRHNLRGKELDNHLPSLLNKLISALRHGSEPKLDREGAQHGSQRRRHGYTIVELLEEMAAFRRIVMNRVAQFGLDHTEVSPEAIIQARVRILDLLDRSTHASVGRFTAETENERDEAEQRLSVVNAQLMEANAQKDRFLSVLSHEMRNPLSPILAAVGVLRRLGSPHEMHARQCDIIERQALHLSKLVDDLLDVKRIGLGKLGLSCKATPLQAAVTQAVESCSPALETGRIDLDMRLPKDPLTVFGDHTRLVQVFGNLVSNACRYTPENGTIAVEANRENGTAVVRVRDTGIGIAADALEHIFEPFRQANDTTHHHTRGLGIGLMIAKQLVEMHGGSIDADSPGLGKGTVFTVRLPILGASAVAGDPKPGESDPTSARRHVLVVEDDDDSREALALALELMGHTVFSAANAQDALIVARTTQPDVFIIDIGLPDTNGYVLARALRDLPFSKDALLIALTGHGDTADRKAAIEAGFDHYVTKPAEIDQLNELLHSNASART